MEPHPEHLCAAYPYPYAPMPAMVPHHGFEDRSQIRYLPPPMPMEHPPPVPNSRLFHLVSPCSSFTLGRTHRPLQTLATGQGQVRVSEAPAPSGQHTGVRGPALACSPGGHCPVGAAQGH